MLGRRKLSYQDWRDIVRRRWRILLICTVLGPILAYVGSFIVPNRPMIVLVGLICGMGVGVGFTVAMELSQQVVRSEADIRDVLHLATLVTIPALDGADDHRQKSSSSAEVQHV